jgi:hypothetical protein
MIFHDASLTPVMIRMAARHASGIWLRRAGSRRTQPAR